MAINPITILAITSAIQAGVGLFKGAEADRASSRAMESWKKTQDEYFKQIQTLIDEMPLEVISAADIEKMITYAKEDYMDLYLKDIQPAIQAQFQTRGLYGSEIMARQERLRMSDISKALLRQRTGLEMEKKLQDVELKKTKLQAGIGLLGQRMGLETTMAQATKERLVGTSQAGWGAFGSGLTNLANLWMTTKLFPETKVAPKEESMAVGGYRPSVFPRTSLDPRERARYTKHSKTLKLLGAI